MHGFVLAGLLAGIVWVFISLGGDVKVTQVWENYRVAELNAKGEKLAKEREKTFAENYRPKPDCITPSGELKRLECRNRIEMARASYYAQWNRENADRFPR
jgi:hypothetical protein